jgi:hypothetical protein
MNLVLVDRCSVVRNEIDATDLLEYLVHISQYCAVEVTVLIHSEKIPEASLDISSTVSLIALNSVWMYGSSEGRSLRAPEQRAPRPPSLEDEPSRRLRKLQYKGQNDQSEDDLKRYGKPPGDRTRLEEREAKVKPIADTDTTRDQSAFDHNKLTTSMCLRTFGLPCRNRRSIQAVTET